MKKFPDFITNDADRVANVPDPSMAGFVVEGHFDGTIGDEVIHMEPGDECVIEPGVRHSGTYSKGYRAIDAFGARRVTRLSVAG